MGEPSQTQGSFGFLRGVLGTIAGGLSSFASLPFGKRKTQEDALLLDISPQSNPVYDQSDGDLSKLYPDVELSETRKRSRLSADEAFEGSSPHSGGQLYNQFQVKDKGGKQETCLNDRQVDLGEVSSRLDEVHHHLNEVSDKDDMNRLSSCNMSDALNTEDETQHNLIVFLEEDVTGHDAAANELGRNSVPVPGLGKDCGARPDAREDYDEGIVNLPSGAMTKGSKQKKSVEHVFSEESPTKKVRFHESNLGDSPAKGCKPLLKKSLVTSVKRKNINEIVDQGIAKRKLLTANEKPGHSAERTCSFGVGIPPIRKRKRADVSRALQKIYPEDKKQTIVNLSRGEDPGVKNSKGVTLNKKRSIPVGRTSAVSVGISLTRKRKRAVYSEISHEETEQMIVELIQTEGRGVKRRRTLTLNETTAVPDGRTCTNGMSGCLIKKRNVADESGGFPKITEYESNVPKGRVNKKLKCNEEPREVINCRSVPMYKDEPSTKFAITHNVKEDDVNRLLSSRRALKLRGRAIHFSHEVACTQDAENLSQPQLNKHVMKRGLNRRFSQRKRTRTSTSGCVAVPNDHGQAGLIVTRSGKAYSHRKEHAEVQPSDLAYTRSQAAASSCIHESIDALQGTKRKRAEKHQRGISRSKKIRRT